MTTAELDNMGTVLDAIRALSDRDPHGYWLGHLATPQQFAEWLHWDHEAQAGRYHPAYA